MFTHIPCGIGAEGMVTVISDSSAACSQYAGLGGQANQTLVALVVSQCRRLISDAGQEGGVWSRVALALHLEEEDQGLVDPEVQ